MSEREAHAHDRRPVVSVVMAGGDLETSADTQQQAAVQLEAAEDQPGRQDRLLLAVLSAAFPENGIDFEFRPDLRCHAILKCRV